MTWMMMMYDDDIPNGDQPDPRSSFVSTSKHTSSPCRCSSASRPCLRRAPSTGAHLSPMMKRANWRI